MSTSTIPKPATPTKGSRRPTRPRTPSDSSSSLASDGSLHRNIKNGTHDHLAISSVANDGNDTGTEGGDDEDGEDEDDDEDDDDDDVFAPSGVTTNKRGHQTGLSMSLSNTSLGKRGRSPGSEEIEERPMSKMSKTDNDEDASDDDDEAAYKVLDESNASDGDGDEDDEDAFEKREEQAIIYEKRGSFSSVDSFFGASMDVNSNLIFSPPPALFDDEMADILKGSSLMPENNDEAVPVRRVRFAEEVQHYASSSSSTESEDEAQTYPDLFVQQSSLDPSFRRLVERNADNSDSDGEGSYWDFENEDRVQEIDEDSGTGSSGYETDEGETTDEDFNVPSTINMSKKGVKLQIEDPTRMPPRPRTNPVNQALNIARKGPKLGSFVIDEDKPAALIDGHGKHMLIFPARKARRTHESSPSHASTPNSSRMLASLQPQSETESDVGFAQVDPMLSSPANTMVSGFYGNRQRRSASSLSNQILAPEAFFPYVKMSADGHVDIESEDNVTNDDDYFSEAELNIEDFIRFSDASSDEDNNGTSQEQADEPSSNNTGLEDSDAEKTPQPTSKFAPVKPRSPSTPTPAAAGSLLDHFDRGVASSFRRNADRHKNWTRSPMSGGIKGGRFEIANTPITPLRRRRGMPATPSNQLKPMRTPPSAPKAIQQQFGGPLMKRIHNSEQVRKSIERQISKKRKQNSLEFDLGRARH